MKYTCPKSEELTCFINFNALIFISFNLLQNKDCYEIVKIILAVV
jgi:hypothetical protein